MARPPRTYEGRKTSGKPIWPAAVKPSSKLVTVRLEGWRSPAASTTA